MTSQVAKNALQGTLVWGAKAVVLGGIGTLVLDAGSRLAFHILQESLKLGVIAPNTALVWGALPIATTTAVYQLGQKMISPLTLSPTQQKILKGLVAVIAITSGVGVAATGHIYFSIPLIQVIFVSTVGALLTVLIPWTANPLFHAHTKPISSSDQKEAPIPPPAPNNNSPIIKDQTSGSSTNEPKQDALRTDQGTNEVNEGDSGGGSLASLLKLGSSGLRKVSKSDEPKPITEETILAEYEAIHFAQLFSEVPLMIQPKAKPTGTSSAPQISMITPGEISDRKNRMGKHEKRMAEVSESWANYQQYVQILAKNGIKHENLAPAEEENVSSDGAIPAAPPGAPPPAPLLPPLEDGSSAPVVEKEKPEQQIPVNVQRDDEKYEALKAFNLALNQYLPARTALLKKLLPQELCSKIKNDRALQKLVSLHDELTNKRIESLENEWFTIWVGRLYGTDQVVPNSPTQEKNSERAESNSEKEKIKGEDTDQKMESALQKVTEHMKQAIEAVEEQQRKQNYYDHTSMKNLDEEIQFIDRLLEVVMTKKTVKSEDVDLSADESLRIELEQRKENAVNGLKLRLESANKAFVKSRDDLLKEIAKYSSKTTDETIDDDARRVIEELNKTNINEKNAKVVHAKLEAFKRAEAKTRKCQEKMKQVHDLFDTYQRTLDTDKDNRDEIAGLRNQLVEKQDRIKEKITLLKEQINDGMKILSGYIEQYSSEIVDAEDIVVVATELRTRLVLINRDINSMVRQMKERDTNLGKKIQEGNEIEKADKEIAKLEYEYQVLIENIKKSIQEKKDETERKQNKERLEVIEREIERQKAIIQEKRNNLEKRGKENNKGIHQSIEDAEKILLNMIKKYTKKEASSDNLIQDVNELMAKLESGEIKYEPAAPSNKLEPTKRKFNIPSKSKPSPSSEKSENKKGDSDDEKNVSGDASSESSVKNNAPDTNDSQGIENADLLAEFDSLL